MKDEETSEKPSSAMQNDILTLLTLSECNENAHGWDVCDEDKRLFGVYVGRLAATARFSTPEDAAKADRLLSCLMDHLAGCTLGDGSDRVSWEPGCRPKGECVAPPLAEAFAAARRREAEARTREHAAADYALKRGEDIHADRCRNCTERAPVNAAAMREALVDSLRFWNGISSRTRREENLRLEIAAALSAPARNCDRFKTAAEATRAFQVSRGHAVFADAMRVKMERICAASILAAKANAPEWVFQRMADIHAMARAALAAPARNCDRFKTAGEAHKAWRATDQERDFADWLFDTEKGGDHANA